MTVLAPLERFAQRRPNLAILAGRIASQAGVFATVIFPALALPDVDSRRVVMPLTVSTLVVASVLGALQASIVRMGQHDHRYRHAQAINVVVGVVLAAVAAIVSGLLTGRTTSSFVVGGLYGLGALFYSTGMLTATRMSVADQKFKSAMAETMFGFILFVGSALFVLLRVQSVTAWAIGYAAMGLICTLVGMVLQGLSSDWASNHLLTESWSALYSSRVLVMSGVIANAFNRSDYLLMDQLTSAAESNRYVIATRLSAPIMIALSALNNSLYVQQAKVSDDLPAVDEITKRFTKKMMKVAALVTTSTVIAVALLSRFMSAIGSRHIFGPASILAFASLIFASTVPWGFALVAIHRETLWNRVLIISLTVDLVGVAFLSRYGAVAVACCWLGTQTVVLTLVRRVRVQLWGAV